MTYMYVLVEKYEEKTLCDTLAVQNSMTIIFKLKDIFTVFFQNTPTQSA